jgi:hypothetical protein
VEAIPLGILNCFAWTVIGKSLTGYKGGDYGKKARYKVSFSFGSIWTLQIFFGMG